MCIRDSYHQLNAMNRPDRDASLLGLVREAFEDSGRRYGYKRVHLELRGMGIRCLLYTSDAPGWPAMPPTRT